MVIISREEREVLLKKKNGEVVDLLTLRVQIDEKLKSLVGEIESLQATALKLDQVMELETERETRERITTGEATPAERLRVAFEGLSPNSRRGYKRTLDRMDKFFDGVAVTDSRLAEYLRHRFEVDGVSVAVLSQILCAIRFRCKALGEPKPDGPMCSDVLRRYRRANKRGRGKAKALLGPDVEKMVRHCEPQGMIGMRDAAMISLGFECLLRASEIVGLNAEDLRAGDDGHGALRIRRSKTDQSGNGEWLFVGAPVFKRVREWLMMAGIESGPMFRKVKTDGAVWTRRMNPNVINGLIQKRAREVGIEGAVRSHSLRRGAAQQLTIDGASIQEVANCGRWKSPGMVLEYTRTTVLNRSAVARRYQAVA